MRLKSLLAIATDQGLLQQQKEQNCVESCLIHICALCLGMHGAAMAWTLIMQSHAAAVELWSTPDGIWRCYEHTAHYAGLLYRSHPRIHSIHQWHCSGTDWLVFFLDHVSSIFQNQADHGVQPTKV